MPELPVTGVVGPPPERIEARVLGDEITLHDPDSGRVLVLNSTAAAIWSLADGTRRLRDVVEELASSYAVDPGVIADDVAGTVERLAAEGFLPAR